MALKAMLRDGQPEAGAALGAGAVAVHAIEAFGEPWQVLGRDPDAGVLHREPRAAGRAAPADGDAAVSRRVLGRVRDQVGRDGTDLALDAEQQAALFDVEFEVWRFRGRGLRFTYLLIGMCWQFH